MRNIKLTIGSAVIGLASLAPFALGQSVADDAKKAVKNAKESVQRAVYDIMDKDSATLSFGAGSATVSDAQKTELRTMLDAFKRDNVLEEVVVVAYSDKDYPRGQAENLPAADRELAEKRGDAVKKALDAAGAKDVKVFNMAEKTNWFERTFNTEDAKVKNEAKTANEIGDREADDIFFDSLGRHLASKGGQGKVVVVARRDLKSMSH